MVVCVRTYLETDINNQYICLKNKIYILYYWSQATIEVFQFTQGGPWYSQISTSAHGQDPLLVGKSVNIRDLLTGQIQHNIMYVNRYKKDLYLYGRAIIF